MTDQEINEAVARKLGWKETDKTMGDPNGLELFFRKAFYDPTSMRYRLPDYCHDIAAAWEIVEWLKSEKISFDLNMSLFETPNVWQARIKNPMLTGEADTAPMAICLAFLKLNG